VIHRDLKPGNIMLGKFGETIVVDWGLAKVLGETEQSQMRSEPPVRDSRDSHDSETMMGAVLGTPGYMSPEQAEGRIDLVDRRSDVFGLGACLYALLTNVAPFKGNSKAESIANARGYRLKPLREVDSAIPVAVDAICMKAMAANPSNRYQQATELADDLDRWIAGEAVTAMPDPIVQRVFRWARRHQALVTGTAVLLLTALLALSVGSYLVREQRNIARTERDRANDAAIDAELQRDKADKALVKSTESNAMSLKVLEEFVNGLGDDGWAAVPHMESRRIAMVDLAVDRFKKLHADNPDDLVIKVRLVRILVRSANLHRMVGKLDKAGDHFSEVMKLLDTLETNVQLKQVGLDVVGDSLYAYANLMEEQQGASVALVSCRQGVDICRRRLLLETESPMAKLGLAMALVQLASLQFDTAEFEETIASAKAGQDVLYQLSATPLAKQFFYPLFDIIAFEFQAKSHLKLGLDADAEKLLAAGLAVSESAKLRFPTDNNIEYFSIQLDKCSAKLKFAHKQLAEGTASLLIAIERMKSLAEKYPDTIEYARNVRIMQAELGTEWLLNDDLAKAKEYSVLAMEGVDIAKLSADASIGELKSQVNSLALALALARREGEAADELKEKLESICVRVTAAMPKYELLQEVKRLAPDVF